MGGVGVVDMVVLLLVVVDMAAMWRWCAVAAGGGWRVGGWVGNGLTNWHKHDDVWLNWVVWACWQHVRV